MSSLRPQVSRFPLRPGKAVGGNATRIAPLASIPGISARFNSTSSPASTGNAVPEPEQSNPLDIPDIDFTAIPERIGYLKELGLDYGWGPSSVVQFVIEHIHIYSGLSWVGSIAAAGLLFRLVVMPMFLRSADTAARISNSKHEITPVRQQMMAAAQSSNTVETMRLKAELAALNEKHGIKASRMFIPMLIQIPLGYGCFRVVRSMASLPVPGLAMEHFAWINDLTVSDPYYLLPAITGALLYLSLRKGGEMGNIDRSAEGMRKLMLYGFPTITFLFTAFLPAALQTYFVVSGIFGCIQSFIINNRAFRAYAGITIPSEAGPSVTGKAGLNTERSLRMLTEALQAERARLAEAQKAAGQSEQNLSFIDRAIHNVKESKNKIAQEASEKMKELSGQAPKKNADGSPAEPPRLSEKDLKRAEDYERRRQEEEAWKREERNHARREAHLRALEQQREKAKLAFNKTKKN
ncbi:60Kd inner membrane protein-domain-containing protein [Aspergillus egyptiacus]|nr:60Kd inner membrane protein-domain-containing protein [Aspergillus egyptiacus]